MTDWIPHNGGPMPVDGSVRVEVQTSGYPNTKHLACEFFWRHVAKDSPAVATNITAYRIVENEDEN